MTTNRRAQNKKTPYKLIVNGSEYGCYKDIPTILIAWLRGYHRDYRLFHYDRLIDSSD